MGQKLKETDHIDAATIDLRIAHLVTTYGPHALSVVSDQILYFRAQNDWQKEQEWLNLYSNLLALSEQTYYNA